MTIKKTANVERRALIASIFGSLFMAVVGIGFALVSRSEAIMLDGVFSGVSLVMAMLTLKIAGIVKRPDDEHFHFGYSHFAPLMNILKSLVMVVLCGFALLSAIDALMNGGRPLAVGAAVIYGVVATLGCIVIAAYLQRTAKSTGSALVEVDAKSWLIDTVMSGAVLASFIAGYLLQDGPLGQYLNYLDPGLVTVLCIIALPIPVKVLLNSAREVLLFAPEPALQERVEATFRKATAGLPVNDHCLRMLKMGDTLNILIHVQLQPGCVISGVAELDQMRKQINAELEKLELRVATDVLFVDDMEFAFQAAGGLTAVCQEQSSSATP